MATDRKVRSGHNNASGCFSLLHEVGERGEAMTTKRDVTQRIKTAKTRLAAAQSWLAELEALRAEMQAAKADRVGELPESSQTKYQDALSRVKTLFGGER